MPGVRAAAFPYPAPFQIKHARRGNAVRWHTWVTTEQRRGRPNTNCQAGTSLGLLLTGKNKKRKRLGSSEKARTALASHGELNCSFTSLANSLLPVRILCTSKHTGVDVLPISCCAQGQQYIIPILFWCSFIKENYMRWKWSHPVINLGCLFFSSYIS